MIFLTSYADKKTNRIYCSHVVATDRSHAKHLCDLRGLGERIDGSIDYTYSNSYPPPDNILPTEFLFRSQQLTKCLHTLCFVGLMLVNAKELTIEELLSDDGLIHSLAHFMDIPEEPSLDRERFVEDLRRFDSLYEKIGL